MKTTLKTNVVGIDFKRWHQLVVDAAPKRKQQTNEEDTLKTVSIEQGIGCQLNTPVYVNCICKPTIHISMFTKFKSSALSISTAVIEQYSCQN